MPQTELLRAEMQDREIRELIWRRNALLFLQQITKNPAERETRAGLIDSLNTVIEARIREREANVR